MPMLRLMYLLYSIQECNKPQDAFGFEQAEIQYSLRTFGQMANTFKQEYFGRATHVSFELCLTYDI